jgi:hypothetical protein
MENIENIDIEIVRRRKHTDYESYRDYKIKTKYDLNYYHSTKREINCPICDKKTFDRYLIQHQKSMKCRLKALEQPAIIN